LIGSLIGGVLGTRGTINQIAVDAARRGSGIGRSLVDAFEFALRRRGVRRYFLFATRANAATRRFWTQQGFNEMTASEVTYERDL
jgi:ribosomal protein S18 acetylase RimI-like enzyme